MDGNPVGDSVT